MAPNLDRANIASANGQPYDDWDRLAEALFENLALELCRLKAEIQLHEGSLTLARYEFPPSGENAFLCLDPAGEAESHFIQLRSVYGSFDFCEGLAGSEKTIWPIADVTLIFVLVEGDGTRHEIKNVAL